MEGGLGDSDWSFCLQVGIVFIIPTCVELKLSPKHREYPSLYELIINLHDDQ